MSTASQKAAAARRRIQRGIDRAMRESEQGGAYGARMEQIARNLNDMKQGLYALPEGGYDVSKLAAAADFSAVSVMDDAQQAEIIMNSPVGSRIFAATVEVWQDVPYQERKRAVLKAFHTNNYKNLVKKLEKWFGSAIYGEQTEEKYDEVVTLIMQYLESGEVPKRG